MMRLAWVMMFLIGWPLHAQEFAPGSHCVAWKAKKRILLVGSQEPVGLNCSIKTRLKRDGVGHRFYGEFVIADFKSGADGRDESVVEILGGKEQPLMTFTSELFSGEKLAALWQTAGKVSGVLNFGAKDHAVEFVTAADGKGTLHGTSQTFFTALGLEPPSVLGGLGAQVNDELTLAFQFQRTQISDSQKP